MDYADLCLKLKTITKPFKVRVIGKTFFKRKIFAVEKIINKDLPTAIFVSAIHGRENITTDLVLKFIDEGLFDDITKFNVCFVVMANPDGVELSRNGLRNFKYKYHEQIKKMNRDQTSFSMWKANARGVDLNNNFDANFGDNYGSTKPASQGFPGKFANSEVESKAIVRYVQKKNVFFTVSYHTKGEEIYYNFFQTEKYLERDKLIAERFANSTGYVIRNVENTSSGGFKDWCVQKLKIPAITIEVGADDLEHPITSESLDEIFARNKSVAKDLEYAYNVFEQFRKK